jgi:hypothetical protein
MRDSNSNKKEDCVGSIRHQKMTDLDPKDGIRSGIEVNQIRINTMKGNMSPLFDLLFRNKPLNSEEAGRSHSLHIIVFYIHQKIHAMDDDGQSSAAKNQTPVARPYGKCVLIGVTTVVPDKAT